MLVYIHIPFCLRKCHYCAFYSRQYDAELEQIYLDTLEKEIHVRSSHSLDTVISCVYIGGGTPTLLPPASMERIINLLAKHFKLKNNLEFSVEANPETLIENNYARILKDCGVNRMSLGVQSLNNETLHCIGRKHTSVQAMKAARIIQDSGITNLNFDLIWGLPYQTVSSWLQDLKTIIKLNLRHVSCYGLNLEPGTMLHNQVEQGQIYLPEDGDQSKMYIYGAELLESAGLLQYEISNFACMGYACRHNSNYWEGTDYLGLGPSAVSCVAGFRWTNPSDIRQYESLAERNFSEVPGEQVAGSRLINEKILLSLRTCKGLNLKDYARLTGKNFCTIHARLIKVLHQNNLIRIANGYLRLTKNGMLVSNAIIERFIQ
ncbi:radical SAM family heme chaperone HemW [Desulfonatronovibrio magnus]|uniref:radical SAM family heme chaperone HemW n=1 Tax=Desulfonatronovibrio magnus TaxID=698827 RepID=UPI0005EBD1E7|nr:radical SAM family heme chaperone HemW [Desulfonatronovibrio magnus]